MENIMLQDERKECIKIVDFGLSNSFNDVDYLKTQCGSPEYAAPELFVKGKKYGPEVDLWSLGVILYVMATGRLPFIVPRNNQASAEERRQRLMAQINRGLTATHEHNIAALSDEYKNLVRRLLTPVARKRIRLWEICRHPWIVESQHSSVMLPMTLRFKDNERLDESDRQMVIDELIDNTGLCREDVENEIANKQFGRIGGMFNIMAHGIKQETSNSIRRLRHCSQLRTSKRNHNKQFSNDLKNKVIKSLSKIKPRIETRLSSRIKRNYSSPIAEYKCNSREISRPFPIKNHIPLKETGKMNDQTTELRNGRIDNTNIRTRIGKPLNHLRVERNFGCDPILKSVCYPFSDNTMNHRMKQITKLPKMIRASQYNHMQKPANIRHPPTNLSQQSQTIRLTATATIGQGDDRSTERQVLLFRNRLVNGKLNGKKMKNDTSIDAQTSNKILKPLSRTKEKEVIGRRYSLRKQNLMKNEDKLKRKNLALLQENGTNKRKSNKSL